MTIEILTNSGAVIIIDRPENPNLATAIAAFGGEVNRVENDLDAELADLS